MELESYIKTFGKIILDDIQNVSKDITEQRLRVFLNHVYSEVKSLEHSKNYFESIVNNREFAKALERN